jgi:hypothetical protein
VLRPAHDAMRIAVIGPFGAGMHLPGGDGRAAFDRKQDGRPESVDASFPTATCPKAGILVVGLVAGGE